MMDLDIEMGDTADVYTGPVEQPSSTIQQQPDQQPNQQASTPEIDLQAPVPNKVHATGLDTLSTSEIRTYVADHFGPISRVEWIDDTSANLIFDSDDNARDAMIAMSTLPLGDPSELAPGKTVPGKPFASKPDAQLHLRMAVVGDRKEPGAAARSRFYLLHPEHDPEERRRRNAERGGRYRDDRRGDDRRRDGPSGRRGRRNGGGDDGDDEMDRYPDNFYDDEPSESSLSKRVGYRGRDGDRDRGRGRDYSRDRRPEDNDRASDRSPRRNHDKELFPGGSGGSGALRSLRDRAGPSSSRNRSASPGRRRYSSRSRSPSRSRSRSRRHDSRHDSRSRNKMLGRAIKDHLIDKTRTRHKELFPTRQLAGFDSKNRLDQLESVFGSARLATDDDPHATHPDDVVPSRMNRRQRGMNIHGVAAGDGGADAGGRSDFNIKGAAGGSAPPRQSARELFPDQLDGGGGGGGGGGNSSGNGGKDLFARAGAGRRKKASDLFDY